MYFKEGKQINQFIEIEGFKLRKQVIREKYKVRVIVLTMDYNYVDEVTVTSEMDIDAAEEVLMQSVYDYIRYKTGELDKVMARFTKG
ncbi:DUF1108 family protein [Staphylococcus coagulans]|uniref:DUF1108 family protein n=1 Tax=Staphylococcus coagulans TaxID=74706 RepID=A0ABU1F0P1_9STAP|nr:DUF1108 family protein [Staphylococcus coagulans]MDR5603940.1 DUF1108 family protein [Staphylococcus coagulans]MDR9833866.1 DUF1108 family protein [Staphylococcus coagulans]